MIFSCCMEKISDADAAISAEFCDNTLKTSPIIKNSTRKQPKISTLKPDVLVFPRDPVREGYVATFQCRHADGWHKARAPRCFESKVECCGRRNEPKSPWTKILSDPNLTGLAGRASFSAAGSAAGLSGVWGPPQGL